MFIIFKIIGAHSLLANNYHTLLNYTCYLLLIGLNQPKCAFLDLKCRKLFEFVLSHFSRIQLFDPMDCSLPRSSVLGILQARVLEWVTQESNPHWQAGSLPLAPPGKPTLA